MIPTTRALAELALQRQQELSLQLSNAETTKGASLLPDVLRRAIVTVSVCHETLRLLQSAFENGRQPDGGPMATRDFGASGAATGPDLRGRYGFVADLTGSARFHEIANGGKLSRAHLALAVDSAFLAYGDLLCAADSAAQRKALDSLLDYLGSLVGDSEPARDSGSLPISQASRKIRVVLEARRSSADSTNPVYRNLESFTVEGTVWSYCAALLAEAFRPGSKGAVSVRAAVRRVDEIRGALEGPGVAAAAGNRFEDRIRRPVERAKP